MRISLLILCVLFAARRTEARDLFQVVQMDEQQAPAHLVQATATAAASRPRPNQPQQQQQQQQHLRTPKQKQQPKLANQKKTAQTRRKRRNLRQQQQASPPQNNNNNKEEPSATAAHFDFVVAGFPKCGTTTLLKAFQAHAETDMAPTEQCAIASPGLADAKVRKLLDGTLRSLPSSSNQKKRSFKCPTAVYNYKSLARLENHSPNAKLIVGMRHPVHMMQSFYNYRVAEIKERNLNEPIPSLEEVLFHYQDNNNNMPSWKGISLQATRFELFLMQMGKTFMSYQQLEEMVELQYDLAIKPTDLKVFLYTLDQLEDNANVVRSTSFRHQLQDFLELDTPLPPLGHENKNHHTVIVNDNNEHDNNEHDAYAETISICDDQWTSLRSTLVQQGSKTAAWIRDHFLQSPDVTVANREHFLQSLESWGVDPCSSSNNNNNSDDADKSGLVQVKEER